MSIMLNSPQGGLMRRFRFSRSAAMLLLALVAGLCAAWAARQYLQDRIQLIEARAKVPMAERIVAAHDLPAGTRLAPAHLVIRSFPAALVSSDSLPQIGRASCRERVCQYV